MDARFPSLCLTSLLSLIAVACATAGPQTSGARGPAQAQEEAPTAPPVCEVRAFKARGNGVDRDTDAIQAAINQCAGHHGIVHFSAGRYLTAMLRVGPAMTLSLDADATILGVQSTSEADYPTLNPPTSNNQMLINCRKALIYALKADDLTIQGPGTIDGQGGFSGWRGKEPTRPMAIFVAGGSGITLRNLKVKDSAMWSVVLMETDHTSVDGLNVNSPDGVTHDGLDIVDGDTITVNDATIFASDDAICLKSGLTELDENGNPTLKLAEHAGLHHVTIQNSHILGSTYSNGLKFGTEGAGPVDSILFQNIDIQHVDKAAMAIESVDGSQISDVMFKKITFHDVGTAFFVLAGWRDRLAQAKAGGISDITFEDIQGDSLRHPWGSAISGTVLPGVNARISNITFDNVNVAVASNPADSVGKLPRTPPEYNFADKQQYPDPNLWADLPAAGLYFRHVEGVHLIQTKITKSGSGDARPTIFPAEDKSDFDVP